MKSKRLLTIKILIIIILISLNFKNIAMALTFSEEQTIKITKNLRCLICQGQSIAESNTEFAQTIKLVVRDKIKEGKTEKEIYQFLIEKYGEWIVYKPQINWINSILWFFPYIVFFIGGVIIFLLLKKRVNR